MARELRRLGHEVRLIAPQLAQPYVARGKNDAADAAALCEAASRPQMRFVPAKTADQQAALMLAGPRERRVAPAHATREHDPRPWGRVWLRRRPALDGDPGRRPADRLAPGDEDAGPASPREHSTAGKARPGRITRAGDPMLRSLRYRSRLTRSARSDIV
jgi:transposase